MNHKTKKDCEKFVLDMKAFGLDMLKDYVYGKIIVFRYKHSNER